MAFPRRRRYAKTDDDAEAIWRYNQEKAEREQDMREKQEYEDYVAQCEADRYERDMHYDPYEYDGYYDDEPAAKPEFHKGFKRIAK